jgi:hypothetical protein
METNKIFTPSGVEALGELYSLTMGELDDLAAADIVKDYRRYENCIDTILARRIENYTSLPYMDRNALIAQLRETTYPNYSYTMECPKCKEPIRIYNHNILSAIISCEKFTDHYTGTVNGVNTSWGYYSIAHFIWAVNMWEKVRERYPTFSQFSMIMLATLDVIGDKQCSSEIGDESQRWVESAEFIRAIPAMEYTNLLKVLPAFQDGGLKPVLERKCLNKECGAAVLVPLTFPARFFFVADERRLSTDDREDT